jgi:hypothetical protein
MKCRRERLERAVREDSEQAGRTCRTKLNTTGGEASQCWRRGVVEEKGGWTAFEAIFVLGKPSSNTFNVGAPTFLGWCDGDVGGLTERVSPLRGFRLSFRGPRAYALGLVVPRLRRWLGGVAETRRKVESGVSEQR